MNDNLDSAIALTLELEGLLMLLRERSDMAPGEITVLIKDKLRALNAALEWSPVSEHKPELAIIPEVPEHEREHEHGQEPETHLDVCPGRESAISILKQSMTLNDKFLFRRELFDNNEALFNENLHVIESIADLADAKDYLYNDLCLDPDNPVVIQFVSLVESAIANR